MLTGPLRATRIACTSATLLTVALPTLAEPAAPEREKPARVTDAPRQRVTRVGAYDVWLEIPYSKPPAEGAPRTLGLGLRIGSSTRDDALRLDGIRSALTVTDDLGRTHKIAAFPGGPAVLGPDGKAPEVRHADVRSFFLNLQLPDDRATSLKSVEGELTVQEAQVHKVELTAAELAEGVERKVEAFSLKVAPLKPGMPETEVSFSLDGTIQGMLVTQARLEVPRVAIDLQDTGGRTHQSRTGRYQFSVRGPGISRSQSGSHSGQLGGSSRDSILAAMKARGIAIPQRALPPNEAPVKLPSEATIHYDNTLKFAPFQNDKTLKSATLYLVVPTGDAKKVPFRLDNVPLPPTGGQQAP